MTCLNRFRAFFTAPVVIFHLNILSYFTFLWLFAYVLMIDFQPTPSWREYVIYFWLFSLVCEETRQVLAVQRLPWQCSSETVLSSACSHRLCVGNFFQPKGSHTLIGNLLVATRQCWIVSEARAWLGTKVDRAIDATFVHFAFIIV